MFRATMCPSSGEITVSMRHLVFVTLYGWLSLMQGGMNHSHRVTNTKCRIDTVISPDDGHIVTRNMQRKEINILRKILRQVGFIYKTFENGSRLAPSRAVSCFIWWLAHSRFPKRNDLRNFSTLEEICNNSFISFQFLSPAFNCWNYLFAFWTYSGWMTDQLT
jgi:hypothetical protein